MIYLNNFKFEKHVEKNTFSLYLNFPNKELLLSLTKSGILPGATITDNYQCLQFQANSIKLLFKSLENFESFNNEYELLLTIFYNLASQLKYLIEKEKKCFYTFNPDNIILIDNNKCIYLSDELLNISENKTLTIYNPFFKSNYHSPELQNSTSLPINIHFKTIFYSLAIIMINIIKILEKDKKNYIKNTKLYFALKRCLKNKPEERAIIFI